MPLRKIYEDYLQKIGKLDKDVRFGGPGEGVEKEEKTVDNQELIRKESAHLAQRLKERFKWNNRIIFAVILLLFFLFALGIFLIFWYREFLLTNKVILSGTFLSVFPIIYWLYRLWREKSFMDITLSILEGLSPQQAAQFISSIYWNPLSTKGEGGLRNQKLLGMDV